MEADVLQSFVFWIWNIQLFPDLNQIGILQIVHDDECSHRDAVLPGDAGEGHGSGFTSLMSLDSNGLLQRITLANLKHQLSVATAYVQEQDVITRSNFPQFLQVLNAHSIDSRNQVACP